MESDALTTHWTLQGLLMWFYVDIHCVPSSSPCSAMLSLHSSFFFSPEMQEDGQKYIFFVFLSVLISIPARIQGDSFFLCGKAHVFVLKKMCVKKNTEGVQKFECGFFDT
jgi:hypothetical protein